MTSLDILIQHLPTIKVPQKHDKIYKDECVLSHDNPESETGLYISLTTFLSFGKDFVDLYQQKTKHSVFLHYLKTKKEIEIVDQGDVGGPEKKITRLAIGVEGGFNPDANNKKFEFIDNYNIVVLPQYITISTKDPGLPEAVQRSVEAVIHADSALKLAELETLAGTWDGEARIVTKHADKLEQLNNGVKIPPSGWKCAECDLTQNLWLNLTDGKILCGRRFHDGSGGNEHALHHFNNTRYPLAVKLGTITKDGKADVYSYDENDMVDDPYLANHLAHFGINIGIMEKTEKSMVELELDLNQKLGEWSTCQEAGSALVPVYGPGRTGMVNLGNSCYLNSVMQVMFSIPDFISRFVDESPRLIGACTYQNDPASDFILQMSKLGFGLCSGKYSQPPLESVENKEQKGINPLMFKVLIGRGHADFSTSKQQDAQEFFLHLINTLERNTRHQGNPADCFKFQVEDRVECDASKKVKYTYRTEYCLPLSIPLTAATNPQQVAQYVAHKADLEARGLRVDPESVVRPHVMLSSCLESLIQPELVEQFYSTAIQAKTTAHKRTTLSTFPDFLMIHLKRFTLECWVPVKLDVEVEIPDIIDLSHLRGTGPQPGEEFLPEVPDTTPAPVLDPIIMSKLLDMGFHPEGCKKAVFFTDNQNFEAALDWVMRHMTDSDFENRFVPPGTDTGNQTPGFVADPTACATLMEFGFTREQAVRGLKNTSNNVERACDWLFSHPDEVEELETTPQSAATPAFRDGDATYRLRAFITHMGTSTMVGHYVCHILKDEQWVIYNDNKVALSANPPKALGYLYLYERIQNQ